jgi:hypothetical protein
VCYKNFWQTSIDLRNSNPTSLHLLHEKLKEISFDMAAACAADIVDWLPPHTHTQKQTNKQTKERIPKIQNNIIITTHVAVII